MIVVNISMNARPIKQKELVQTLLSLIASMEKETGGLNFNLFSNIEDQNFLNLVEEWQTRKELDHHLKSKTFGILLGTRSLLWESPTIQIQTVSKSEGMEAVDAIRN